MSRKTSTFLFKKNNSVKNKPMLKRNSGISKNKGTSLWSFVANNGLALLRQIDRVIDLARQGGRVERYKLDGRRSTS